MKRKSKKGTAACVGMGVALSSVLTAMLAILFAWAISKQWMPWDAAKVFVWIGAGLSVLGGCWLAARQAQEQKSVACFAVCAIYIVLCLIGKAAFYPTLSYHMGVHVLILPLAALVALVLAKRRRKRRR